MRKYFKITNLIIVTLSVCVLLLGVANYQAYTKLEQLETQIESEMHVKARPVAK